MQIKMNTTVSGPGIFLARNQVYDLPKDKAEEFLAARFATAVPAPPAAKREKATQKPLETR
jgi:hypothetical protein